jgi:flagellar motor switch/type III secretory pathway protein FliN
MGVPLEAGQQVNPNSSAEPIAPQADLSAWQLAVQLAAQAVPKLTEIIQQFWGVPVRLQFLSVSLDNHYYWRQDDFHVSQLVLGEASHSTEPASAALLRISDTTCASLLGKVLGARQKPFNFKQISPLEAAILNDFSRDLLASLMKAMLTKSKSGSSKDQLHFIWTLQVSEDADKQAQSILETGKIILSVPPQCLRISEESPTEERHIADDFFFHVKTEARIRLGQARLPFAELNQLERGDWVVLEESDAQHMALVDPQSGEALSFSVEIAQKQKLTVPYTQELAVMETQQTGKNLWDNLMIEVNAEFAPVKLPLKQLKQMSEGLIVEVGDLVQNQISLQVEGKTLAWGELIIVGDKFGVRVTKVEGVEAPKQLVPVSASQEEVPAETPAEKSGNDNDEDLDNFLNDSFDDEDEW